MFVCLREKPCKLTLRRRCEFFYGDDEADFAGTLLLFEREMMQQSQLFGNVFLCKLPVAHKAPGRKSRRTIIAPRANVRLRGESKSRLREILLRARTIFIFHI